MLFGCSVPVAGGLSEVDANEVLVALEQDGVVATKEAEPEQERGYRVLVGRDDASAAITVLTRKSLPRVGSPGVLDALGKGALVPSRSSEHAKVVIGTAGELERSLNRLDGVLSARVHLAVLQKDSLSFGEPERAPTASVLLRYRGATPPITPQDVQRLVAGAVPGLQAEAVTVVSAPSPAEGRLVERELARFGPITLTRGSLGPAKLMVGGIVVLNLVWLGVVALLWLKQRRDAGALATLRAEHEALLQGPGS